MQTTLESKLVSPEILPPTEQEIVAYLRSSYQIASIVASAKRNALILSICQQLKITCSEGELQAASDSFRQEQKLLGVSETLAWLKQQQIDVEDWSEGIRISLLTKKLKEHLFGEIVDKHYLANRNDYKRVALSQILVSDRNKAFKITKALREENASFCALAIEYSQGKKSKENGGFVGIKFLVGLLPEILESIMKADEGELISPVKTKLGYHILRVEKWFAPELNEFVRQNILDVFFQNWIEEIKIAKATIK